MDKIDIVYLWVDGNDAQWIKRKEAAMAEAEISDSRAVAKGRYAENDELRYSLRSLEMYAGWINRIFIITDGQTPAWLDTSNPRVNVVFHSSIVPERYRPLFNSTAIEMFVTAIPDLSEKFLYANDDTFFNRAVEPSFFFDADGRPIVRLKKQIADSGDIYSQMVLDSQARVKRLTGKRYPYEPHHNIDSYSKSSVEECMRCFADEIEATRCHRFRKSGDFHRSTYGYYALAKGEAVMKYLGRYDGGGKPFGVIRGLVKGEFRSDSRYIPLDCPDMAAKLRRHNPALFCVNDSESATDDDRRRMKEFLEARFPTKTSFEK